MSRLENKESAAISPARPEVFSPFLSGFMTQRPHKSTPPPSITSTSPPSIRSTPLTSPENSPFSFKSAPPRSPKPPLSSSTKSTPAKSSTLALTTTTKSAPLKNGPTIQNPSEPTTDDDEYSANDLEAESISTLDNTLETVQIFCKYGILAPRKQSRDSKVQVTRAFKLIQSVYKGEAKDDKQVFTRKLTSSNYERLLVRIATDKPLQDYFNDKLRFDYSHDESEFVIRMPGPLHDHLAGQINRIIFGQLDDFIKQVGTKTAELAGSIYPLESADVKFPSRLARHKNKKGPDKSYVHEPCDGYPPLVIEVAWSQDPLDLSKLAKKYIQGSKGAIRTMIGINLPYWRPTEAVPGTPATFSIWRPGQTNKRGVPSVIQSDEREFRDSDGEEVLLADLRLPLTDFVCRGCLDSFVNVRDEIVISSTQLCKAVTKGEGLQRQGVPVPQRTTTSTSRTTAAKDSGNNAASRSTRSRAELRRSARLAGRTGD